MSFSSGDSTVRVANHVQGGRLASRLAGVRFVVLQPTHIHETPVYVDSSDKSAGDAWCAFEERQLENGKTINS